MILSFKFKRARAILAIVLAAISLIAAFSIWLSRPTQIAFSDGSMLSIREVVYSRNAIYYHEPFYRLISRNARLGRGWGWLNARFPKLEKRLGLTRCQLDG